MMSEKESQVHKIVLEAETELRFEVETKSDTITLELKSGFAEICGMELGIGIPYTFTTGANFAVFTWHGCTLELRGKKNVSYVAKETPMAFYLNCHAYLEEMRVKAESEVEVKRGPIAMVVGSTDVGKSTVCRILLNYAIRMGRAPVFVDLDVDQGQLSVPGSIGALPVERPAYVEEDFSLNASLIYHYGHESIDKNPGVFNMLINKLSEVVHKRLQINLKSNTSGIIINTCGRENGEGYEHVTHAAQAFDVDIIFVLGQDKLFYELVQEVPSYVKVIHLPKSRGTVEKTQKYRRDTKVLRVREYFYGGKVPLHPHSFDVKWSELKVFKIDKPLVPDSCLPLGMKAEDNKTKLVAVQPGPNLLCHLLAVSFALSTEEEEVITSNIAGYICVTNVDVHNRTVTVLSSQPRHRPDTILILSDIQFMDDY